MTAQDGASSGPREVPPPGASPVRMPGPGRRVAILRRIARGGGGDAADLTPGQRRERVVVVLIGVTTAVAAILTYLALLQDSLAGDQDRESVLETVRIQQQEVDADIQVHAEAGFAARYRRALAEADAIDARAKAASDPADAARLAEQARLARTTAQNAALLSFDTSFLKGSGASAVFDEAARRTKVLRLRDNAEPLPSESADKTAERADRLHESSERLVGLVVVLFGAVLLLTIARLASPRWRRLLIQASVVVSVLAIGAGAAEYVMGRSGV